MFGAELVTVGDIILAPNLTRMADDTARCNFTLLVNRNWTDKGSGNKRETRASFPVVCWGSLAENVAASLAKGDRVLVTGRLEERTWTDEHRGEHTRLELTAFEIGPSIYVGTCTVTKNPRRGEAPAPAGQSAPAARPTHEDDEPF